MMYETQRLFHFNAKEALVHMLHLKRCSWHLWHTNFTTLYVHAICKMLSEALVPMKAICSKWEFSHIVWKLLNASVPFVEFYLRENSYLLLLLQPLYGNCDFYNFSNLNQGKRGINEFENCLDKGKSSINENSGWGEFILDIRILRYSHKAVTGQRSFWEVF